MKCFNHREMDAIAVCKHCGRALCSGCVSEIAGMSACKGRCEAAVEASSAETQLNRCSHVGLARLFRIVAFVGYTVGLAATGVGAYVLVFKFDGTSEPILFVLVGIGLLFLSRLFHHMASEFKRLAAKLP